MRTRSLGRADVRVSELALGTWGLGAQSYGQVDLVRFEATVKRAIENGVTTLDVSPDWGQSEAMVADAVGNQRDDVQYITRTLATTPMGITQSCEKSLKALRTDRIDVLLLNHPEEKYLNTDALGRSLDTLKGLGKIRTWGVSTSDVTSARAAIAMGADVLCVPHNILASDLLMDLSSDLALRPVGILARSPLAYGLLADTWTRDQAFGATDHRSHRWSQEGLHQRLKHVESLRFLVHGETSSLADAAIRYVLANPAVGSCVLGARSPAQIASAARLAVGPPYLDENDLVRIPQILASLGV